MSLQIVQNQQLVPIGDKVAIDTTLSSSSENAISNKAVTGKINELDDRMDATNYTLLANGIAFSQINIDCKTLHTGDRLRFIIIDAPSRTRYVKEIIVGIDITQPPSSQFVILGGHYIDTQYNGCCAIQVDTNFIIKPQSFVMNGQNVTGLVYIALYEN